MSNLTSTALVGLVLSVVQCVAALPWLSLLLGSPGTWLRQRNALAAVGGVVVGGAVLLVLLMLVVGESGALRGFGKIYGAVLHLQLAIDLLIAVFALVVLAWPKGGAVALAAFREGVRQPMYWLIVLVVVFALLLIPFLPYFTLGEDHLMAKDLGLEVIRLGAVLFGVLLASLSISEEIEGRTAVTLMSKPVSRRQFLLGKFLGILMAGLLMAVVLGWGYAWMMDFKHWYDRVHWYDTQNPAQFPESVETFLRSWVSGEEGFALIQGAAVWALDAAETLPGLVLGFCHVMVLLAVAVCLATRLPVAANIVTCFVVYVLGHLSPILVQSAQAQSASGGASAVSRMLTFVAMVFDRVLPGLQLFSPTRITDVPIPLSELALYSAEVAGYSLLYTALLLIFGLVLFEDRDLA